MKQGVPVTVTTADRRVGEAPVEIVERKGVGHPDTLCDGVAEALSVALANLYRTQTGGLLHFNMDKILLAAGEVERDFGGGRIVRPMTLYVGDRATSSYQGRDLNIPDLVQATAWRWFSRTLPRLDVSQGLRVVPVFGQGSAELSGTVGRGGTLLANDTSAAVGYAPFTPLEMTVRALEQWLNGAHFKETFPATGEDVKVMAVRQSHRVELTVAMPFLAARIPNVTVYTDLRRAVEAAALKRACELLGEEFEVGLKLNALDNPSEGSDHVYLTLSGTSAEHGDSGETGRGNNASGLISCMRPNGAEAACGKNPWSHVGKVYSMLAFELAAEIHREIPGIEHVAVWLVSRIGDPVAKPRLVAVEVDPASGNSVENCREAISDRVTNRLEDLTDFCLRLEQGAYTVY